MIPEIQLQRAVRLLLQADALVIAAGAGMGVDSGLPDFRGDQGFWTHYPALGRQQIPFYAIASPQAFRQAPELAWGFYGHRLQLYRNTRPHAGFGILREWAAQMPGACSVFTSNVDGQFQKAGFEEQQMHECHGSVHYLQCLLPCRDAIWPASDITPEVDVAACRLLSPLPRCPHCGGIARPNILMFNDSQWLEQRCQQQQARQQRWLAAARRPLVIEIGAGTAIPSVRHFSLQTVQRHHGHLLRINLREPSVERESDTGIAAPAAAALQVIHEAWQASR
ncbi:SIR2 family NAD-dependent protein deacylase [Undibacterium griseum]|uniref:protein acetyllysine N-acetyltransferase n=1 Tax=Undibacterium griseum TaxID=2762295 RepID=A0ABR6YPA5_9BURK|nr:Sir2 family NAD-dependent protein deacetylase [Undibacterium griseum]MBC3885710.1 NAD-dependent deacetylase [Undibacterium griseum]